jgi:hypothetical protein
MFSNTDYARQLCSHVLMTAPRRTRWERVNFARLGEVANDLKRDFDIDILEGVDAVDSARATLMFHRRHLYSDRTEPNPLTSRKPSDGPWELPEGAFYFASGGAGSAP